MSKVYPTQIDQALDLTEDDAEAVRLSKDEVVYVSGCSARAYVSDYVRRFPHVRKALTAPYKRAMEVGPNAPPPTDLEVMRDLVDMDANIDCAAEAESALIAICCDRTGDEEFEARVRRLSDKAYDKLLLICHRKTWGDNPAPFFDRVQSLLMIGASVPIPRSDKSRGRRRA